MQHQTDDFMLDDSALSQASEASAAGSRDDSNASFSLDNVQPLSMESFDSSLPSTTGTAPSQRKESREGIQALLRGNALQNRLLTTFLPTALVPLLLASFVGFGTTQNRTKTDAKNELRAKAVLTRDVTTDFLNEAFKAPANVASNPAIIEAVKATNQTVEADKLPDQPIDQVEKQFEATRLVQANAVLNQTLKQFAEVGGLAELFITEKNGFNVAYSTPTSDLVQSDEDWWKSGKELGQWIGDPEFDDSTNSVNVELVQSVLAENGDFLGVIKAGLPFNAFNRLERYLDASSSSFSISEQVQLLDTGAGEILKTVDAQGSNDTREITGGETITKLAQAIAQRQTLQDNQAVPADNDLDLTSLAQTWESDYGVQDLTLAPLSDAKAVFSASFVSQGRRYSLAPVAATDWVAIASAETAEINATANQLLLIFLGTALLLGAAAALITQMLSRQLSEPLKQEVELQRRQSESLQIQLLEFLDSIEGAAQGDLTVHAEVSSGEMGTVADFFNLIVSSLREIVGQVKQATAQVNDSITTNEGSISRLADETLRQSEEINASLQSVEVMTQSIQAVAQSASQAATISQSAAQTAVTGEMAMDKTVETILSLRGTVSETAKKVKRLGESSQQISKVVALINQIALKTNLLAVNASIEAARAGEEGQGFAVVAEEVGALAEQSATATKDIEKIVESIQRETNAVVEAMEVGTSQVVEGTQQVEGAKQSLEEILNVSRQINGLLQSISEATVSQTQASTEVTTVMQGISQVSEQASASSREVVSSLQETVAIAQQLETAVSQFKVSNDA